MVELRFEAEGIEIEGAPNFILPVLGGNYHFLSRGNTDLYAGAIVGLGLLATGNPIGDIEISSDVALGLPALMRAEKLGKHAARAGFDWPDAEGVLAKVAEAIEMRQKPTLVWLEFQDCAGNTESFLRSGRPTAADIVLDVLSIDYQETIMAAAGHRAEEVLAGTIEEKRGDYVAVVEGHPTPPRGRRQGEPWRGAGRRSPPSSSRPPRALRERPDRWRRRRRRAPRRRARRRGRSRRCPRTGSRRSG